MSPQCATHATGSASAHTVVHMGYTWGDLIIISFYISNFAPYKTNLASLAQINRYGPVSKTPNRKYYGVHFFHSRIYHTKVTSDPHCIS